VGLAARMRLAQQHPDKGPLVIVELVSYFFRPLENVASQRWSRFADALRAQDRDVRVTAGPWLADPPTPGVTFLPDPISEFAHEERARLAGLSSPTWRNPGGGWRRALKTWLPTFLFIDGKWYWSCHVFWRLLRLPAPSDDDRVVVVTGVPWSVFPAAALACKLRGIPYVLDFRDHWAANKFPNFSGSVARAYFGLWERFCVRRARRVITVSEPIREYLARYIPAERILVVPNGYQGELEWTEAGFNSLAGRDRSLLYCGTVAPFHGVGRFFDALAALPADLASPSLVFVGRDVCGSLRGRPGVRSLAPISAEAADRMMASAGVLLMTLDETSTEFISGKLMAYLKAGRPVLYFGPAEAPAARLIREADLGWVVDCGKPGDALVAAVREIDAAFRSGAGFSFHPRKEMLQELAVPRLATRVGEWIDQACAGRQE
jgi:glycosyltransferase involved in cell wall biosynthesis